VTINGVTYSLGNPYDFAYPVLASGNGGLGLSALAGWYGAATGAAKFGATDGDQTTGGQVSFGPPGGSNRALGLLATSSTGATAFGVRFINGTAQTLNFINLQFTGEVWRQSNLPKTLQCYYWVDLTGTNTLSWNTTAFLPALNVSFPTVATDTGGVAVDGTASLNQTNLGVLNQLITNWPAGAALWLVWQMTDATGKAQGLAIDNLTFSASVLPSGFAIPALTPQFSSRTNLLISCASVNGLTYQMEGSTNLNTTNWAPLGDPVAGTGQPLTFPISATNSQRFFRVLITP